MFREAQEDEALAFARQLPEVRALVEDLRLAKLTCQIQRDLQESLGNPTATWEWEAMAERFKSHLVLFKEVPSE